MSFRNLIFIILSLFTINAFAEEQLVFAVDLIRHGDRTPIEEIPKATYHWREGLGELTAQGKEQELKLGAALRNKYVDQYHLLPATYQSNSMYVRSTDYHRTIESAKSFLLGFYPNASIPIYTVPKDQDNLLLVKPTKNVFSLVTYYLSTHKLWTEKSIALKDKLKYWNYETGMPIDQFRQLATLGDNLYIRQLHHVSLPAGLTSQDANEIINMSQWAMATNLKYKQIAHPMGSTFLTTLSQYFHQAANQPNELKYILFSAHDSSIMSVMSTLGMPLDKVPPYASDLNFSLFKNNKNYFVTMSLNNQPLAIPACGGYSCSLDQFIQLVNKM